MAKIKRNYTPGVPSVTTIISKHLGWKTNGLIGWAHKLGCEGRSLRERDDAALRGSCAHDLVAAHYDPEHGDLSEWRDDQIADAKPNAARVVSEIDRRGWTVVCVETAMECTRFAGTLDMVVRDADGDLLIVDLKTSRTAAGSAEWVIQIGAYAWLYRGHYGGAAVMRGAVIHAPYGSDLSVYPIDTPALMAGEQLFRLLLDVHEIEHRIRVGDALPVLP